MKKMFALIMTLIMVVGGIQMPVNAAEKDSAEQGFTREEILNIVCEVFPEHADTIKGEASMQMSRANRKRDEIVFSETRETTDKNLVSYTEYASGRFLASFSWGRNPISSTSVGGAAMYEENFWLTCSWSTQTLLVSGVKYTISAGYDIINSRGTLSGDVISKVYGSYKATENASGSAYAEYSASFGVVDPAGQLESTWIGHLKLTLGNNRLSISAY